MEKLTERKRNENVLTNKMFFGPYLNALNNALIHLIHNLLTSLTIYIIDQADKSMSFLQTRNRCVQMTVTHSCFRIFPI